MSKKEKCPVCGKLFDKHRGALSRSNNGTYICPDCGTLEALNQWEKILNRGGVKNV